MPEANGRHAQKFLRLRPDPQVVEGNGTVSKNVDDIIRLENESRAGMGWGDAFAHRFTAFAGSMTFAVLHVVFFTIWIAWNYGVFESFGLYRFDEPPFGWLIIVLAIEAVLLSTFVLTSQNRADRQADRRSHIDLQVNMLAEQEITRLAKMVADIHQRLGLQHDDEEVAEMEELTREVKVEELAKAVDVAEGGG